MAFSPYAGNIDPSTDRGSKLWNRATKGSEKKFNLSNKRREANKMKQAIDKAYEDYCWGTAVNDLPIEWNNAGDVTRSVDIMTNFRELNVQQVCIGTGQRFDCQFDADEIHRDFNVVDTLDQNEIALRVRAAMIGQWLLNSLSNKGMKFIRNHASKYQYRNTDGNVVNDGATILLLILKKIMPSTKVGLTIKRTSLMDMKPSQYDEDIGEMLNQMHTLKTEIEAESGKEYEDFILHVFRACELSKNDRFKAFVTKKRDEWDTDESEEDEPEILSKLHVKWNNICAENGSDVDKKTKSDSTSSKDSTSGDPKFVALVTALTSTISGLSEQVHNMQKKNGINSGTGQKNTSSTSHLIAEWRKSKTLGDEVQKDNKTYFWCPHHQDGKGLYVTHHPLDHGKPPREWQHTRKGGKNSSSAGTQNQTSESTKLQLSNTMKAALTTNGMSDEKAEEFISSLQGTDFW
jgi:hypothetical protein